MSYRRRLLSSVSALALSVGCHTEPGRFRAWGDALMLRFVGMPLLAFDGAAA